MNKPRGLGRGLDVLLPGRSAPPQPPVERPSAHPNIFECALEHIVPNRAQPRQDFDEARLDELAESIRMHGLIEPLVVRRLGGQDRGGQDRFEIVAGERRWRAAQRAGLREVPVVVKDLDEKHAFEIALIENVQREDLNPIDFAEALRRLIDDYGHTQESLVSVVGKERTTITNALRLLRLPDTVRSMVVAGTLTEGHARALLGAPDEPSMLRLADLTVRKKLSVRQVEAEVKGLKNADASKSGKKSAGIKDIEQRLSRKFGTRCELRDRDGKGEVAIRYANLDELDRILELLL
ncbi:MAG TPA: ParB/RepB/Spo0J family partition protein [Polyangiaceae bacterium]|jgi:ParB family chromosome partitioning protein|nr:ParB/RepB/Spo0J family partition protein [Polyangiaceae bacterium]